MMPATAAEETQRSHYHELHWQQGEVFSDPSRFKVLAAGRRWGKTSLDRTALVHSAIERPNDSPENWHAYIAPDLMQARRVMWRALVESVPRTWIERDPNQTRMEIQLINGQILVCLGADNPDSLRGMGFRRVILDEPADMKLDAIWEPIILPALLTSNGDALINGTPKGFDAFYAMYRRGMDGRADWRSWQYTTRQAPHITPEMYAALVAEYSDPRIMRQELEASFESSSGTILGALWQDTRVVQPGDGALLEMGLKVGQVVPWHVIPSETWRPPHGAAIYGSVDYGFGAPCAIYLHAVLPGGHIRTFWELYQRELHDDEQARRLRMAIEDLARQGVDYPQWIVLEPVMFGARREMRIAKTIAEVYADVLQPVCQIREGAGGRSARLSRPQRWMTALSTAPDGLPWWTCTTACPHLSRTVRLVRWDPKDPEVEDERAESHAYESVGRFFEARPITPPRIIPDELRDLDPVSRAHHEAQRRAKQVSPGGRTGLAGAARR